MYAKKYLKSVHFNLPIICVGNLSLGGTGKSPMVEHLLSILSTEYKTATLSRGYKRKTKGYALATEQSTALEIGDEPMQFHLKYPNVGVAVGERRIEAIPQLIQDIPDLQTVILDDAFQHREIDAHFSILLTEYDNLYCDDFFFPTGDLRDERKSAKRANIIVVTKCPLDMTEADKLEVLEKLYTEQHQSVFFTAIAYETPYHIYNPSDQWVLTMRDEVLLVCGIAMRNKFEQINAKSKLILTTEKDAVRLVKYTNELNDMPLYVLPIKPFFLFNQATEFNQLVIDFVAQYHQKTNEQ
jgi:tetraacyldisaccharide 4'-kinase